MLLKSTTYTTSKGGMFSTNSFGGSGVQQSLVTTYSIGEWLDAAKPRYLFDATAIGRPCGTMAKHYVVCVRRATERVGRSATRNCASDKYYHLTTESSCGNRKAIDNE